MKEGNAMKKKTICLGLVLILLISLLMGGCGKKKESNKKAELSDSEEIQTTEIITSEQATVEESEDGSLKVTTEGGEEIKIDPADVEVEEEADGSKTYTTSNGQKVKVTSDGTASVIKTEIVNTETGEVVANKPSSGSSSSNNNSSGGNSNGSSTNGNNNSQTKPTKPSTETTKPSQTQCSHSWDAGTVTKAATCTEKGVKTYTCTKCGKTKTGDIACVPHTYSWVRTKEPTTTEEGLEEYKCSICGYVYDTRSVAKKQDLGQETNWSYSGNTRTKTMYDGTVVTETKYSTSSGETWGYYDDAAAQSMFAALQEIQRQAYGEANVGRWADGQAYDAKLMAAKYAAGGTCSKSFHMNSGGLPNVEDNMTSITFVDSYGGGFALACFVRDAVWDEQFTYGPSWRSYFGTYYSSAY